MGAVQNAKSVKNPGIHNGFRAYSRPHTELGKYFKLNL